MIPKITAWHDRLGNMIDQVGHPDYSLRELVNGLRNIRDEMIQEIHRGPKNKGAKMPKIEIIASLPAPAHQLTCNQMMVLFGAYRGSLRRDWLPGTFVKDCRLLEKRGLIKNCHVTERGNLMVLQLISITNKSAPLKP
jgi:hypothetical protein